MSDKWYSIFGPKEWGGVVINTDNKKIDGTYFNFIGDKNVQWSAAQYMWLVGASGIRLISEGFVDVSGLRGQNLLYQQLQKIDTSGNVIPAYEGTDGAFVYKQNDNALTTTDDLIYDSEINKITLPNYAYGPLYVGSGTEEKPEANVLKSYPYITYEESIDDLPPVITIDALTKFTNNIAIYPDLDSFQGSILTHMGEGKPAEWASAPYLKAEGVLWNRFPKRPILIERGKIYFYIEKPIWAQDWAPWEDSSEEGIINTLKKEFGDGDTIELVTLLERKTMHVKLSSSTQYIMDQLDGDKPNLDLEEASIQFPKLEFRSEKIKDPDSEDPTKEVDVFSIGMCKPIPWVEDNAGANAPDQTKVYNAYAHSVTKGGFFDMQLGRNAKDFYHCFLPADAEKEENQDKLEIFTFKPSTSNTISIRPETHTAFNVLAEDIDFVVYGKTVTNFNNYENIFDPNPEDGFLPSGLVPALRIDSYLSNISLSKISAIGNPSVGVVYDRFLDRAKLNPTGWIEDNRSKVMINTHDPYIIDKINWQRKNSSIVGDLTSYADLTVNSSLFAPTIIAEDLYLTPKPLVDNSGKYIRNALLTLDKSGKIISRVPRTLAKVPDKPRNLELYPNISFGNGEIALLWQSPNNDGGSEIENYEIEISIGDSDSFVSINNPIITEVNLINISRPNSTAPYVTIKGLTSNINYYFRVAAVNAIGYSEYSDVVEVLPNQPNAPISVRNLIEAVNNARIFYNEEGNELPLSDLQVVSSNGDLICLPVSSDVVLEWSKPPEANNIGYLIEESVNNGQTWVPINDESSLLDQDNTYITISDVPVNQDVYYRVFSVSTLSNNLGKKSPPMYIRSLGCIDQIVDDDDGDALSNWDFGSIRFSGVCAI